MKHEFSIKRLLIAVMFFLSLPVWAGEKSMGSNIVYNDITFTGPYVEMQINFGNSNFYDSWTRYLKVYAAGTEWEITKLTGNQAMYDHGKKNYELGSSTKNGITMKYGWTYKSGDDYWVRVKFYFSKFYYGYNFNIGFNATYRVNQDYDVSCSNQWSCTTNIYSNYWMSYGTATSKGKNQFNFSATTGSGSNSCSYTSYLLKEDRPISEMTGASSSYSVGKAEGTGADKTISFLVSNVTSNYSPTKYYQRFITRTNDFSYYDYRGHIIYSPYFMRAKSVKASVQNQWKKTVIVTWSTEKYNKSAGTDGWWLITRKGSSGSEEFVGTVKNNNTTSYTTPSSSGSGKYKYKVSFVPTAWGEPTSSNFSQIRADDLTSESGDVDLSLVFQINDLNVTDIGSNQGFKLKWTSTAIGDGKTYTFYIYRYSEGQNSSQAVEIGTVNTDKAYEFTDNNISDYSIQYTYYVNIDINGEHFSSQEVAHFSSNHSTPSNFIATTGEYENLISLTWKANNVGTSTSYYEIYRKKESQTDIKYILIASMSGTESSYSYTDNSINPGDIYDYKLVMYQKRQNGTQYGVETLYSVGFASRTGVITGSVTFDTGTAVDDVMVKLENADAINQESYSLRIDGPGSGISWTPEVGGITDIFGKEGNSWTVQTLINPDEMDHNANFMQLGDLALSLGNLNNGYYNLTATAATGWVNAQTLQDEGNVKTVQFTQIRTKHHNCGSKTPGTYCYIYFSNGTHMSLWNGHTHQGNSTIRNAWPPASSDGWVYYTFPNTVSLTNWQQNVNLSDVEILVAGASNSQVIPNVKIPAGRYSSLNIAYNGSTMTVTDIDVVSDSARTTQGTISKSISLVRGNFSLGSVGTTDASKAFTGYLDEIRIYSGETLAQDEILNNYDRYLSGMEKGLVAYWKLDEGISNQKKAYDCSLTNGTPNSNHADIVGGNYRIDGSITSHHLTYYAKTDSKGSYVLRGIPYKGTGTNFTVTPFKGVHKFSPATRTRLLSQNINTINSTDFTDISSFPVSGVVYYEGTNYPVEDAIVYVDGEPASIEGELVMTNCDGEFEVSVPIGDHFISIKKDGHTFVNNGRYPEKGTVGFYEEVRNLTFQDNTLVVFAGRVCGGSVENNKPLGMAQSVNNIGKALVSLSTKYMTGSSGMLNVKKVTSGKTVTYDPADSERTFQYDPKSQTQTTAIVGKSSVEDAKTITIETDAKTGEFAVLLPPLRYIVEGVNIINNKDGIIYQNIGEVDLTDTHLSYTDSLVIDSTTVGRYEYNGKLPISVYHPVPEFTLVQNGRTDGSFGEKSITKSRMESTVTKEDIIDLYTLSGNTVKYTYNYPVFNMLSKYQFNVRVREIYNNYDGAGEPVTQYVPLSGSTVTFANSMSAEDYGLNPQTNELVAMQDHTITLDSLGEGKYVFRAGFPNIEESMGYRLGMDITYNIDGTNYQWNCPYFADIPNTNGKFYGINFGNITLGNDFVTAGPDRVDMILRDPPGSNSFATWQKGSTFSTTHSTKFASKFNLDGYIGMQLGVEMKFAVGIGFLAITEIKGEAETGWKTSIETTDATTHSTTISYTATDDVSTSDSPEWDGPDADLFIGTSTNTTIGTVKNVGLHYEGGAWKLGMKQQTSLGEKFSTTFNYTRYYIENILIPQYEQLYKEMSEKRNGAYPNCGYATITKDNEVVKYDSLEYFTQQIQNWKKQLAINECEKVTAIDNQSKYLLDNFSFDSGAKLEKSTSTQKTKKSETEHSLIFGNGMLITSGITFNGVGVKVEDTNMWTDEESTVESEDSITWSTFGYTLHDSNLEDALSVDVYQSPENFSPIFRTRGGRTSGYYEPQRMTKYLKEFYPDKFTAEREIMSSTKKVFVPKFFADKTEYINVPTGSQAQIELTIANQSESGDFGYFTLAVEPKSNPHNAEISFNGTSDGSVTYLLYPGQPQTLTVGLRQTNLDVKDYSILLKLLDNTQSQDLATFAKNADTIRINVHFVEASSNVDLAVESPYCNTASPKAQFTLSGYDLQMKNLKQIGLQYLIPGRQTWVTNHTWGVSNEGGKNDDKTIREAKLTYPLSMENGFIEGTYQFRAFTKSNFGGEDIYAYSDIVNVTKDTSEPQMFGVAQPSNGVYGVGSEISISFNEDIVSGDISKQDVLLRGVLNDANDDVSIYFNGDNGIITQSKLKEFSGSNTMTLWLKRLNKNKTGAIFHREGAAALCVDTEGHLVLVNEAVGMRVASERTMPYDKWVLLSMSVNHGDKSDRCELYVIEEGSAESSPEPYFSFDYSSGYFSGKLKLGEDFVGYMKQMTVWDKYMDIYTVMSTIDQTKTQFTSNLLAYWPMNEGSGLTASEVVSNNSFVLNNKDEWHIERTNYTYSAAKDRLPVFDTSDIATGVDDDWAIQFWFRANSPQTGDTKLFTINGGATQVAMNRDTGRLSLVNNGKATSIGDENYMDSEWHRFGMNVSKSNNGLATIYIDGNNKVSVPASEVSVIKGYFVLGSDFYGNFDEVRLFHHTLSADKINQTVYQKLNTSVSDPVFYLPFEADSIDQYNQLVSYPTFKDMSARGTKTLTDYYQSPLYTSSTICPPVKSADVLTDVEFDVVKSDRTIQLKIKSSEQSKIQSRRLYATVRNIRDFAGNVLDSYSWDFLVSLDKLRWNIESLEKSDDALYIGTIDVEVVNNTDVEQAWTITNVPSWMTLDHTSGTTSAYGSTPISIQLSEHMPVGLHSGNLYLNESETDFSRPLPYTFCYTPHPPYWNTLGNEQPFTMTIVGQVIVDGAKQMNTSSQMAAFDSEGHCVGSSYLRYYERTDGYYVSMTVYGSEDSSTPLRFRFYDANTGLIYAGFTGEPITFKKDSIVGSYLNPYIWTADGNIQQVLTLKEGWSMFSINVVPTDNKISSIFTDEEMLKNNYYASDITEVSATIQSATQFSVLDNGKWDGELQTIDPGKAYKWYYENTRIYEMPLMGRPAADEGIEIKLEPKWNWIGANVSREVPILTALSDINPETGDLIKISNSYVTQTSFASFEQGGWIGDLEYIVPAGGYMYYNNGPAKTFRYPTDAAVRHSVKAREGEGITDPIAAAADSVSHLYVNTMLITSAITLDGMRQQGLTLRAYDSEGNLRGIKQTHDEDERSLIYMVVYGESAEPIHFTATTADGTIYEFDQTLTFNSDQLVGTPSDPHLFRLEQTTGIQTVSGVRSVELGGGAYNLAGQEVESHYKGIVIDGKNNKRLNK